MSDPAVSSEVRGNVLVVHIDDGKANALSAERIATLIGLIDRVENDTDIAAMVLHGREGGAFCAGFDLNVMRGGDLAAVSALVSDGGALIHRMYGARVPVVAACTGHALAAGALLLLGCDVRFGADVDCKIGLNEVAIGMVLPDWAITLAADRLSKRHVQRSIVNGRITDAAGAVEVGFLDAAVPAESVLDAAIGEATALAALPALAYAGTVRSLRGPVLARLAEQIAADRARGSVPTV